MLDGRMLLDGHADGLSRALSDGRPWNVAGESSQADLPALRRGGVDLQFLALFAPTKPLRGCLAQYDLLLASGVALVRTRKDLERLGAGEPVVLLAMEGGEALGREAEFLDLWYRLGLRSLSLTWNGRNDLADGIWEEESGGGLTRLGRRVVERAGRLGVVIDVAHLARRGFWDVLELGAGPVFYSHGGCRALAEHPRNLADGEIAALAEAGGTVGLSLYPPFLTGGKEAGLVDLLAQLDHLLEVGGTRVPALGSDFDGVEQTVGELRSAGDWPRLLDALLGRYPEEVIRGFLGENLLHLLQRSLPTGGGARGEISADHRG